MFDFIHMVKGDADDTQYTLMKIGIMVPQGLVLSYQLSISEVNFDVSTIVTRQFYKNQCTIDYNILRSNPTFTLLQDEEALRSKDLLLSHVIVTSEETEIIEKETINQSECDK